MKLHLFFSFINVVRTSVMDRLTVELALSRACCAGIDLYRPIGKFRIVGMGRCSKSRETWQFCLWWRLVWPYFGPDLKKAWYTIDRNCIKLSFAIVYAFRYVAQFPRSLEGAHVIRSHISISIPVPALHSFTKNQIYSKGESL